MDKNHHHALAPFNTFRGKVDTKPTQLFKNRKGAIYIHVPFCLQNCRFCILYKEYPTLPYEHYVSAILRELGKFRSFKVEVLYFGRGTPTLLPAQESKGILNFIYENSSKPIEISVESTINEFNKDKAEILVSFGVNRISFGVQSFNDKMRAILGRWNKEKEVVKKLELAKEYFEVVSVDLLYDTPYGNILLDDVKKAIEVGVDGISIYPLVYNKAMNSYPHPSVEKNERDFLEAYNYLLEHGYRHLSMTHFSNGKDEFHYSKYFTRLYKTLHQESLYYHYFPTIRRAL